MNYFTFGPGSALGRGARFWRLVLITCLLVPFFLVVSTAGQSYDLEPWQGGIPNDALLVGQGPSGGDVYICVADHWDGQHPGMLDASGICHVAWGGQGHEFSDGFSVVLDRDGSGGQWQPVANGGVPSGAFPAGDDGGPIYVCRVAVDSGFQVGKVTDDGWCFVGTDGEEMKYTDDYEVLVD